MSWFLRLAPLALMSACGGTTLTRSGDGGAGGSGGPGVGGSGAVETGGRSAGGAVSGGGGATHGSGGVVSGAGGSIPGSGGSVPGSGGSMLGSGGKMHEPTKHRPAEVPCGTRPNDGGSSDAGAPPSIETCAVDGDCSHGFNGRCISGRIGLHCTYDVCFGDGDCAEGAICMCSSAMSQGSHCSQPGCRIDADCPGSWCSPTFSSCGTYSGVIGYQCHTKADECTNDTDCAAGTSGAPYCMYEPMVAHWICSSSQCAG